MSLQSDLEACFNQTLDMTLPIGSDDYNQQDIEDALIEGIIGAFKTFITTAQWTAVYSGTISLGTVTATVVGSTSTTTLDETQFLSDLRQAIVNMTNSSNPTTDQWADALTDIFIGMCAAAEVTQPITGTAIPNVTPPPTVPVVGTATGNIEIQDISVRPGMRVLTAAVNGNNSIYASSLSTLLKAAMTAGLAQMQSDAPIDGLSGTGTNIFNN